MPSNAASTRIVLVDNHRMLRGILRGLLESEPRIEVVGEADDGTRGLQLAEEQKPDVVISDLKMRGMDGMDLS